MGAKDLQVAIESDDPAAVMAAELDGVDDETLALLGVLAVRGERLEALAALVERRAGLGGLGVGAPPPTWVAASLGSNRALEVLLAGDPDSASCVTNGVGAATVAALHGHGGCLEQLVRVRPELLRTPDAQGGTPALVAAAQGHASVLQAIAELAPDALEIPDASGLTAMDHAWNRGFAECVDVLRAAGCVDPADRWACDCSPGEPCGPDSRDESSR